MQRPTPVKDQLRAQLAQVVLERIEGWTLAEAAARLSVYPTRISQLRNGHLEHFSILALVRWIESLGYDVDFTVKARRRPTISMVPPTVTVSRLD